MGKLALLVRGRSGVCTSLLVLSDHFVKPPSIYSLMCKIDLFHGILYKYVILGVSGAVHFVSLFMGDWSIIFFRSVYTDFLKHVGKYSLLFSEGFSEG